MKKAISVIAQVAVYFASVFVFCYALLGGL